MSKVICERNDIVAIADAVRNKTGSTDQMTLGGIVTGINSITGSNNGTDTSDATATANEIFKDKTAYVANGKVTGTFTIDDELTEQNELISQISTLVATKAIPPSTDTNDATATAGDILSGKTAYVKGSKVTGTLNYEDVTKETNAYTDKIASLESAVTALETELQGKASGGSSNGVEVEVITITETDTSQIPFTLKRVTKTIGSYNGDSAAGFPSVGSDIISSHINTYRFAYSNSPTGAYVNKSEALTLSPGELVASQYTFAVPYVAVFINDPTQPAIYEE